MHRQILLWTLSGEARGPDLTMLAAVMDANGDADVAAAIRYRIVQLQGIYKVTLSSTFPIDPWSFGRCEKLLSVIPELNRYQDSIAKISPEWARLVALWSDARRLYELDPGGKPLWDLLERCR